MGGEVVFFTEECLRIYGEEMIELEKSPLVSTSAMICSERDHQWMINPLDEFH